MGGVSPLGLVEDPVDDGRSVGLPAGRFTPTTTVPPATAAPASTITSTSAPSTKTTTVAPAPAPPGFVDAVRTAIASLRWCGPRA